MAAATTDNKVIQVRLEDIRPNPYQPATRVEISDEVASQFANSILTHGLMQTPVARQVNSHYEMADGWLRRAGFKFLLEHMNKTEYASMPVMVRELNDMQMADMVMEANTIRQDLNQIELAKLFKHYIDDFKMPQGELAKRHNCSQGEISNTIRLLELPADIQGMIISQIISGTHGRLLLRLSTAPKAQSAFAEKTAKEGLTVNQLDNAITRAMWDASCSLHAGGAYNEPQFDISAKSDCAVCDKKMSIADPWGNHKKEPRCLDEKCWKAKQAAAEKVAEAKAAEKLEKAAAGAKVITKLDYNQYEHLEKRYGDIDNPGECKTCPKRALYKSQYDDKPEIVCLNPNCYRGKKSKKTRELHKTEREQDKALTARLVEIAGKTCKNRRGALLVATRRMLQMSHNAEADADISLFLSSVPVTPKKRIEDDVLRGKLATMNDDDLVKLLLGLIISSHRRQYPGSIAPKMDDALLNIVAIMEGTYEKRAAELAAWQKANCTGCSNANQSLIDTSEPCCDRWHGKIVDGVCSSSIRKPEEASA